MSTTDVSEDKLQVSKRLQFLIKNMIDNKNQGWSKTKNQSSEL